MNALPPPCSPGGRVGLVASSGPVRPDLLAKGVKTIRAWGLVPVFYHRQQATRRPPRPGNVDAAASMPLVPNENYDSESDVECADDTRWPGSDDLKEGMAAICKSRSVDDEPTGGFLSASDQERAAQLAAAFADSTTSAVLCIRGGYGIARLLPLVDWTAAARGSGVSTAGGGGWRPKRFFGFSDASVIHAALQHGAAAIPCAGPGFGLISFHAPMIATGRFGTLPSADRERLRAALFAPQLDAELFPPLPGLKLYRPRRRRHQQQRQQQRAVGVLVGGNLATLASMAGNDWALGAAAAGACKPPPMILALEDENETAIRIDRHFQQLRLSGLLDPIEYSSYNSGDERGDGGRSSDDDDDSSTSSSSSSDGDGKGDDGARPAERDRHHLQAQKWGWPCVVGVVLGQFERTDILDTNGVLYSPHGSELRRREHAKARADAAAAARTRASSSSDDDDAAAARGRRSAGVRWCCARLSGGSTSRSSSRRRGGNRNGAGDGGGNRRAGAANSNSAADAAAAGKRFGKYDPNPDGVAPQAFFWRRVVGLPPELPTLWRCAFGHGNPNATLPLGAVCAVDVEKGVLELATEAEVEALQAGKG